VRLGGGLSAATVAVGAGAGVLGVAAEAAAYDWAAVRYWLPDLAVGWSLVACGLVARGRCGTLLWAAGLAWFAGNFAAVDDPTVAGIAGHATFVHRALLAQAVLSYPEGRLASRPRQGAAVAAYAVALWPALAASDVAWIAVALVVALAARSQARPIAGVFALTVAGVAAGHSFSPPLDQEALRLLYDAGLVASASMLAVASVRQRFRPAIADRVVELGETASMRDALRRVLDDPSLDLAFVRRGGFIDERGRPFALPPAEQRLTAVEPSGSAVLVHAPSIVVEELLTAPVWRALRLTAENAGLQADGLEQLAELRASRRRLVLARGRQRALVARRLREGAARHLAEIETMLAGLDVGEDTVSEAVELVRRRVRESQGGIAALALGLQPAALARGGLAGALANLVEGSTVPVELLVDEQRFAPAIEHAAYLVCSEALANVSKHAGASSVVVRVESVGNRLEISIADDGRGGADPTGRGLRGLRERVQELGGTLGVICAQSGGTQVLARIPTSPEQEWSAPIGLPPVIVEART
jgi:signal transduction histidine kinase